TACDLRHFAKKKNLVAYIEDPKRASLVNYFFLQYEEMIRPYYYELRCSIIHNDANDLNVLVKDGLISGIIDFGDMCHTWLINELAIALTYIMMNTDTPLEKAIPVIKAYNKEVPLKNLELELLYYLIASRLCTSVCNSAYAKRLNPSSSYITVSEKGAWLLLKKWLTINPLKAKEQFFKACEIPHIPQDSKREIILKRKKYLSSNLSLSYVKPIEMFRSAFQYMYSSKGDTYLDAYNNIMLAGHSHPYIVSQANKTMARLNTNTRYLYPEITAYAEKLLSKFPQKLNKIFFVNSGSAASDLAIRLAQAYTKKSKLVGIEHGYHGNTQMGVAISHYKFKENKELLSTRNVVTIPMPKFFGSSYKNEIEAGREFARKAIDKLDPLGNTIAAFIAEPIIGCGGQVPLPVGYLEIVYSFIRKQGGLCISDEVQVGFGRLGDHFWGFDQQGVIPDIVILGKPMGNGHPIGAVITTNEIAQAFEKGPEFFSSFGGNPVSCAIGMAVLDVIEKEKLQSHAKKVGEFLKDELLILSKKRPEMADVRGLGLFLGIELLDEKGLPDSEMAKDLKEGLKERLILTSTDGPCNNVLKIKPPLSFSKQDAKRLVKAIDKTLEAVKKNNNVY
ncbi:aminotransferase class III-fold pyridoxal phosphate-dependent enzyme, partial [Eudoraea sp.]|uniref:aminotransferase class III-fold pyridoxal phosphate-dependent enzyme n=1 Tax=Eudoraea sp. TaxID=1979955 RepID=UPI003C743BF9